MALRATSLHPLTRPAFCTPYAPHVLATADALLSSACHCEPRPCTRRRASSFSMSLRPCNRRRASVFCMSLRASAHTGVAIRIPAEEPGKLAAVRANSSCFSDSPKVLLFISCCRRRTDCHVASLLAMTCRSLPRVSGCNSVVPGKFAHTYQVCHCEPVRTLVWQSASPQKSLASWLLFGQIRRAFRICPKCSFSFCGTARSTDCHVASLLAMTCRSLPRVSGCNSVVPGKFAHTYQVCHCEPVRTLVWQSASPQGSLASWLLFGQIRRAFRIRPKYCFSFRAAAGDADCHVASLLAMTGGRCHRAPVPCSR